MLRYFSAILPVLLFWAHTTSPLIFDATSLTKTTKNGLKQTIILLGDCHEYLSEVNPEHRAVLKKNTSQQRQDIIALAKDLQATVLIEDMVYGIPCHTLFGLPTMITLAMDRYLECYHHQVITNLTTECLKNGIDAHSVECRHACAIIETPPPYFMNIINTTYRWWSFISTSFLSASSFLINYVVPFWIQTTISCIKPIMKQSSLNSWGLYSLQAHQWLEIKGILDKAKQLHTNPNIQKTIHEIEKAWLHNHCYPLDNFVDLKALNYIIEHPEKETIIICAGAWHTDNIADYLEKIGYERKDFDMQFSTPQALKINKEKDLIQPIAILATCHPNYASNAT